MVDFTLGRIACYVTLALSIMCYVGSGAGLITTNRLDPEFTNILLALWIHIGLIPSWFFLAHYLGGRPFHISISALIATGGSVWALWTFWSEFSTPLFAGFPFIALFVFYFFWGFLEAIQNVFNLSMNS